MPGLGGSGGSLGLAGAVVASPTGLASTGQLLMAQQEAAPSPGGGSNTLKRTVSMANQQSKQQTMPSEQEMLMDEMGYEPQMDMMDQMQGEETMGY